MLGSSTFETFAASPSIQATVALLFLGFVVQWYFSLPPAPKFPKAELDEKDWHGSLMKAKSKVCYCTRQPYGLRNHIQSKRLHNVNMFVVSKQAIHVREPKGACDFTQLSVR
jgi:hypothetical protein